MSAAKYSSRMNERSGAHERQGVAVRAKVSRCYLQNHFYPTMIQLSIPTVQRSLVLIGGVDSTSCQSQSSFGKGNPTEFTTESFSTRLTPRNSPKCRWNTGTRPRTDGSFAGCPREKILGFKTCLDCAGHFDRMNPAKNVHIFIMRKAATMTNLEAHS